MRVNLRPMRMGTMDTIIAVKDVNASAEWYQAALGCKRRHEGTEFAVLTDQEDRVILCLHKWDEHDHPTMKRSEIKPGNGLIIYYRTDNLDLIRQQLRSMNHAIKKEIEISPGSMKREFSLLDPDGYYLTIADYHEYQG